MDAKGLIRDATRTVRAGIGEAARRTASDRVAHEVLGLWDLGPARIVLAYLATPEELDPFPIVEALRIRGLRIAMPRVEEPAGLAIHEVHDDSELVAGAFGILEPASHTPRLRPDEVDAVLVPGVAYDVAGNRIGYGGGFYDGLLPNLRGDCVRIGLAFDEQLVEAVPVEPHDASVDLVVTPSRVLRRADAPPADSGQDGTD